MIPDRPAQVAVADTVRAKAGRRHKPSSNSISSPGRRNAVVFISESRKKSGLG
jgi:hypothetical protein